VPRRLVSLAALSVVSLAATVGSFAGDASSATSPPENRPLRVLVTNDDGVGAPGIDVLVQALRKLPNTTVIVVAPKTDRTGSGGRTTNGPLKVTNAKTASGYPAKAVAGYPADTIVWAIDKHGLATPPDVVLSGVNNGQNIGQLIIDLSGTIGAARAAAKRGISALAVSAGFVKPPAAPAYALATKQAVAWLTKNRATLPTAKATVTNLNVPTCLTGTARAKVIVKVAPKSENPGAPVDCVTPWPKPTTDVSGFVHGYIVQTNNLPLKPAA
jgi:5'/3'-nucleotidase